MLDSRPTISVDSVSSLKYESTSLIAEATLKLKSEVEAAPHYGLTVTLYRNQASVRMRIDDISPERPRERYRIPAGDIIIDHPNVDTAELKPVKMESENGVTTFSVPGMYKVAIVHSDFVVRMYNKDGVLVQVLNSRNYFTFEKYRKSRTEFCPRGTEMDMACHPRVDAAESWAETFTTFVDEKPFGPSAVGLDISFVNSRAVFGIPEHTVGFNLPLIDRTKPPRPWYIPDDTETYEEYRLFNCDVYAHEVNQKYQLYGSVPLLTSVHEKSVSGMLWLNPSETYVTLSREVDSAEDVASAWVSETGIMDMFFLMGPSPQEVSSQYHFLTGLAPMAPLFSLGYHQSHWGYASQTTFQLVNRGFDDFQIPMDVMWMDVLHTDGFRYMTWNQELFPSPLNLTIALDNSGRKLVAVVDPHIKVDPSYSVYSDAKDLGIFIRNPDGTDFIGWCWSDLSSWIDFTRPDAREFWKSRFGFDKYRGSTENLFIWNDMNEPAVFGGPEWGLARTVLHGDEKYGVYENREVHNLFGHYNHRATYEGLLGRTKTPMRPFVLSRSFFAGSHRFSAIWTGDNAATWRHLKASLSMMQSLAISGMSFTGADVGGFEFHPSRELFIRWYQLGALTYPFYRSHSHIDYPMREPWTYDGETLHIVRKQLQMRYKFLPMIYTSFALFAHQGLPYLRPLWYNHLNDPKTISESIATEESVMIGDSVLVRGIFSHTVADVDVYLPDANLVWYDLNNALVKPIKGGSKITVPVSLDWIPTYIKGGSVIPLKATERNSTKLMAKDPYSFAIFLDPATQTASGFLYIDDGESMRYQSHDEFTMMKLTYADHRLTLIRIGGSGSVTDVKIGMIDLIGSTSEPASLRVDGVLGTHTLNRTAKGKYGTAPPTDQK